MTVLHSKDGEPLTYTVVICKECWRQAQWLPIDRLGSSWQCPECPTGYRYLGKDQIERIEVVPADMATM